MTLANAKEIESDIFYSRYNKKIPLVKVKLRKQKVTYMKEALMKVRVRRGNIWENSRK